MPCASWQHLWRFLLQSCRADVREYKMPAWHVVNLRGMGKPLHKGVCIFFAQAALLRPKQQNRHVHCHQAFLFEQHAKGIEQGKRLQRKTRNRRRKVS